MPEQQPSPGPSGDTIDLAADLAQFASGLTVADLPGEVLRAVKANLFDTLSCAVAGSSAPAIDIVRDLVDEWSGAEQADAWVFGGRYPAHHAAWLNSAMAHARDYDDTHDAAILHAGVSCVPSAVAAAQLSGCSGADLLAAVAAGLEVTCRLGTAVEVDIIESGFIYSSLLGYFGATAAAGRALGLDRQQMWDAFGIVYSSVAGNHQVTRDASLMKRLQPGLAAQAGVVAAQLALRGIRGAREVFDGADGFSRVYLQGRVDNAVARDGLGARYELMNLSYKPYPCCRDTHAAVDAALDAARQSGRAAQDIKEIKVGLTGPGYQMVCVPEEVRRHPKTVVEAQFSIPYTVAAAWIDQGLSMSLFTPEGLGRSDVLALAGKVVPYVHEGIDREWRRYVTPAALSVEFLDGSSVESRVDWAKGNPKHPMSPDEFTAKSADCATFAAVPLADDLAGRLSRAIDRLDASPDASEVVSTLVERSSGNVG